MSQKLHLKLSLLTDCDDINDEMVVCVWTKNTTFSGQNQGWSDRINGAIEHNPNGPYFDGWLLNAEGEERC